MLLFQDQIEEHSQLANHYRELAAKRESLARSFLEIQSQAPGDLNLLKVLLEKCFSECGDEAIASLKDAVFALFSNEGGDGGNCFRLML